MLLASGNGTEAAGPEAGIPAGLFYSSDSDPGIARIPSMAFDGPASAARGLSAAERRLVAYLSRSKRAPTRV